MAGSVFGYVRDDFTLAPINNVMVTNPWHTVFTGTNGLYSIDADNATFDLTADKNTTAPPTPPPGPPNYYSKTVRVTVNNNTVVKDFYLRQM